MKTPVGGGPKKVLYTLDTVRRIGLLDSAKALRGNNTCKACGLGMGGQRGGMTNELGEFPAVCNKSVQAQSTDIQPPIPDEIFAHSLDELRELSPYELEHLGRLTKPLLKAAGSDRYTIIDWDDALERISVGLKSAAPERQFYYSSGRSSNEAGFLLQLLARAMGTNNVNNCSYYCHQATSVGLTETVGTGTATVELEDLSGCDCFFLIGANPASNHPRLIHQLMRLRERGGEVIVINPAKEPGLVKFAVPKSPKSMISGGTEIASSYLQPNIGSDLALLKGLAKAVIELGGVEQNFIDTHTEHFAEFQADIAELAWEEIERLTGIEKAELVNVAEMYIASNATVFAWGMGITHHQHGSENVEYIANLAMLRGMVGRRHAGLLPLRGHSNVQGIGTIGVKPVLASDVLSKLEETTGLKAPTRQGYDTLAGLEAAERGDIDFALIVGGNLYAATPQSAWASDTLNKIPTKVFLTTTLNTGHVNGVDEGEVIVLPVLARDEEPQSTTQESMFNYVRLSDGGITRLRGPRSEVQILSELGARSAVNSGVDFTAFGDHETVRDTISKVVPGLEQLADIGVAKREFHIRGRVLHTPEFKTASQKAHFIVRPLPAMRSDEYPYLLASVRSEGQFNSIIYEERDSYRFNAPRDAILMGLEDMVALGVSAGDRVDVVSATGTMHDAEVVAFDLPPGNVMAYYPEANVLTSRDRDGRSQTPRFKSVPVRIEV